MAHAVRELLKIIHTMEACPQILLARLVHSWVSPSTSTIPPPSSRPPYGPWWKEGSYNEDRKMVYNEDIPEGLDFVLHDAMQGSR